MPRLRIVAALCACLTVSVPARAEGNNAADYGTMSCSEANALFEQPIYRTAFRGWAMGFMSGANMAMMSTVKSYRDLSNINADLVVGTLREFCAENSKSVVLEGVERLFSSRTIQPWSPPR